MKFILKRQRVIGKNENMIQTIMKFIMKIQMVIGSKREFDSKNNRIYV
jgi:hypothetical protein